MTTLMDIYNNPNKYCHTAWDANGKTTKRVYIHGWQLLFTPISKKNGSQYLSGKVWINWLGSLVCEGEAVRYKLTIEKAILREAKFWDDEEELECSTECDCIECKGNENE